MHFHAGKDLLFFATDDDMAVIDIGDKKMRRVGSRRSEDIPEVDAAPPANPLPDEPRDKPDDPRPEPPAGEDRDAIKPYDPASGEESVTLEAPRRKAVVLDRRLGYTMEVPSWPKPTGGGQTVMLAQFFDSKGAGTLQPNVNINAEQRRVRQDQLADDMRATYSRLGSNVTLGDARNISCDGKDGVQMDVASTINNTRMVCRVACIIDAPLVYTVTCVCTDEDKADYLDRFDVCIGSIRFSGSVDVPRGCVGYANADYGISLHSPKWAGEVAIGRQETPTFSTRGIQIMAKVSDLTIVAQMSPLAAKDHLKMWKDVSAKVKNDEALDVSCGLHTAEGQYWENNDSTGFYLAVNRARRIMLMVKAHSTPQESRRLARPMAKALRTFTLLE